MKNFFAIHRYASLELKAAKARHVEALKEYKESKGSINARGMLDQAIKAVAFWDGYIMGIEALRADIVPEAK